MKDAVLKQGMVIFGTISGMGFLMRIMHWPYAIETFYFGLSGLAVFCVLKMINSGRNKKEE